MSANTGEPRSWKETIKYTAVVLLVFNVLSEVRWGYKQSISVFAQIRPLQVVQDMVVLIVVAAIAQGLVRLHPMFHWWVGRLFNARGKAFNFHLLPAFTRGFGPCYLVLLAFVLPQIASIEESMFRKGTTDWRDAVLRSLLFGLVHVLVGVPLAAAIAIAVAGMWFSYCYFHGGVAISTVHHTTYDLILVLVLLFLVLVRREKLLASLEGNELK